GEGRAGRRAASRAGLIGGRAERRQARSSSSITGISPVRVEWLPPLGWEVTVVSTKAQSSSASTAWRKWVRASRSPARSSASSCRVTRRVPRTPGIGAAGGELCAGGRSPGRRAVALAQRAVVDQELRVAAVLGGAVLVHGLGDRIGQGRHGNL